MPGRYPFTFDPQQRGLRRILGPLESSIMDLLWAESPLSVREVHAALNRRRDIAYTTVMTVMSRLATKGILRRRKEGNAFLYEPVVSREAFTDSVVRRIMSGLLKDFSVPAVSYFVDSVDEIPEDKLDELARLIDRKRGKGGP